MEEHIHPKLNVPSLEELYKILHLDEDGTKILNELVVGIEGDEAFCQLLENLDILVEPSGETLVPIPPPKKEDSDTVI